MRLFLILLGACVAFVYLSRWATPQAKDGSVAGEAKMLDALYTRQTRDMEAMLASGTSADAVDPESGDSLLTIATQMRYREGFELLLRNGADVNCSNDRGYTPLMCAVLGGRDDAMIERLIESGADVNARAANGMTALMIAAMMDYPPLVDRLLRAGARVDVVNYWGKSALDLSPSPECRARLQAAGAARLPVRTADAAGNFAKLSCNLSR
jgi:hypothetical protein